MTEKQPNIVVIIPTLNEERFIERCLESIGAQSYPSDLMDIVIVDGGSTDKTCEIIHSLQAQRPNIRLVANPRRLRSAAFNVGVQASTAPIILCMDAHSTYETHYIERCVTLLTSHPEYGNVGGACDILPQNDSLPAQTNALLNHLRFGIGGAAFRVGTKAEPVDSVPFGAFRREVVEQIGGMRDDVGRAEDNEYNSRIRKAGYIVWFDPEIRSSYYARATVRESMKQMFANGKAIGNMLHVDSKAVGLRHMVPLGFVLALVTGLIAGIFTLWGLYAFAAIFALYLIADIAATISACVTYGWKYALILPVLFFLVHTSYGIGTIFGLFKIK